MYKLVIDYESLLKFKTSRKIMKETFGFVFVFPFYNLYF